ncbi:MAG: hypothetical protein JWO23_2068 [Solirubrobacterales bacterium]|nr:hypothetical protein [Solirubrobacterales bacterium]
MKPARNRRLRLIAALLAATSLATAAPAPAGADVGETIIQRCTHGQSLAGFSQSAYKRALKELSADAEEYTDCAAQIRQAQLAAAGGGGGGGAVPVAIAATPAEQRAIARAGTHAGAAPVRVGAQLIHPGVVHANVASALSTLPTPLLALIAFLLASVLAVAGSALRNRIRARRSD